MKKSLFLSSGAAVFLSVAALASTGVYAEGANSEVNLTINPVLSINATESLDLEVVPTAAGVFTSGDIAVDVITNDATGYSLYLSSNSAETALVNSVTSANIPTVSAAVSSTDMAKNTWGFSLGDKYNPVPASGSAQRIKKTAAPATTSDTTSVSIGAKVDTSIPSGAYSNTLLFTAIANSTLPAPTNWTGLLELEYMQDMTPAKCAALPTPSRTATETSQALFDTSNTELVPELVLTDKRDNKQYVTRKLADGNCWMTQNLDLDGGGQTLTAENTDLNDRSGYTMRANSPVGTTWNSRYYDNVVSPSGNQYLTNGTTSSATGELYEHIGNYYTWAAATAGSGTTLNVTGASALSSICPKGWQLPEYEGNKSWSTLIDSTYKMYYEDDDDLLRAKPLTFVRSGFYEPGSGSISDGTSGGTGLWGNSVSPYGTSYAAMLDFYPHNGSNPQNGGDRSRGFAIRCVAR